MSKLIDDLKAATDKIHFFGLGFIQLKMKNPKLRYHFYHKDLPRITPIEEIHNHRYAFQSRILAGSMTQVLYNIVSAGPNDASYLYTTVSCDVEKPVPKNIPVQFCNAYASFKVVTPRGGVYQLVPTIFHTVESDFGVTELIRAEANYQFATVIRKIGDPVVCPFSEPGKEDELWQRVESMIQEANLDQQDFQSIISNPPESSTLSASGVLPSATSEGYPTSLKL